MPKTSYKHFLPEELRLHLSAIAHPIQNRRLITQATLTDKSIFSIRKFNKLNAIFVHVTKTGGTAIAQALVGEQPFHYRAIEYRAIYGFQKYNKMFKFGFVRNPWDRLYSAWSYLRQGGWHDQDKKWYQQNIAQYKTFEEFVMLYLDNNHIHEHKHLWPQYAFLCNQNKEVIVDYVGRFETLNLDFEQLKNRLGLDGSTLLAMNTSDKTRKYQDAYSEEMIDKTRNIYNSDCGIFGYDFDSSFR